MFVFVHLCFRMRRKRSPLIASSTDGPTETPEAVAEQSRELVSLLDCENLPLSRWCRYTVDGDSEGDRYRQMHSDDEHGDSDAQKRRRKLGKNAR